MLVRDNPAYDVEFIKQHARIFIDARQHGFDPASPEAQTAVQRGDPIHVVYTGVVPLVYKAQRSLLDSLIQSTFWSFVTITPLMMFLSRNIIAGIVVMLPNVLPVVVIFGGMGWLNIDVDVGSMMTASIALGVAVDDTIHFLTWFREDFERLGDRNQAILAAYRRCALPTMQAAVISGLGLSVFALSTFTPTQRFGYLMLTILFAGVVAELIMLPALLAGPLGRFCNPRVSGKRSPAGGAATSGRHPANEPADAEAACRRGIRPAAHHGRRLPVARRRRAAVATADTTPAGDEAGGFPDAPLCEPESLESRMSDAASLHQECDENNSCVQRPLTALPPRSKRRQVAALPKAWLMNTQSPDSSPDRSAPARPRRPRASAAVFPARGAWGSWPWP